jgi:hypothetical protein
MVSKTMNPPMTDPEAKDLRLRMAIAEWLCRCERINRHLIIPSHKFDRDNFAIISSFNLSPDLGLVEFMAPIGDLFTAVRCLSSHQQCSKFERFLPLV